MKVNRLNTSVNQSNLSFFAGYIFASRLKSLNKTIYHHHFNNAFHGAHVFLYGPLRFEIAHHMIEHTAQIIRNYL